VDEAKPSFVCRYGRRWFRDTYDRFRCGPQVPRGQIAPPEVLTIAESANRAPVALQKKASA